MQTTHIRNKLYLHGKKVALLVVFLFAVYGLCLAQKTRWVQKNNPNYDERKLSYGFLIGLHTTAYQMNYSDAFVDGLDTLHSVEPPWSAGFSLGFIVNYRLEEFFDFRITPKVAFYEHRLKYVYTDDTPSQEQVIETTMVELPILLKYKSERRGNIRMYMVGGVKPGVEASGKNKIENAISELEVKGWNLNLDFGFGFDLYYPLFKFSPEIRFSKGLVNILDNTTNQYGQPLDRLNTNTITIYFLFQ
ncbi:MAG TPA: porin family protein [Chryseosolibacter sp.]|nr:porin family protein [Chryseosolibacter sp.]